MSVTLVRYWGSHLKNPRLSYHFAAIFRLAAAQGWRTCLVCSHPPDDPDWLAPLHDTGTRIEYIGRARGNFDAVCTLRVFKLCRRLQCDVFHCDNMHTSPLIGSTLAGTRVRLWSKRSMQPAFEEGRTPTLRDRLAPSLRLSCLLATKTLPVSPAVEDELVRLRIPASKLIVFPNPLLSDGMGSSDRDQARASLRYHEDELVITTVGHAVPVKGWDILLSSFGRIASLVPEARLLFIGSTTASHERSFAEELQRTINGSRLSSRIRFAGHMSDVSVALAASDIVVVPSRSEGFGVALVEALSAGLPCISSRVGAAPDLIRHGQNGLLVDRGDIEELARFLLQLARSPKLREKLSRSARLTRAVPSLEEYAERLIDLYKVLLCSTGKSREYPVRTTGD